MTTCPRCKSPTVSAENGTLRFCPLCREIVSEGAQTPPVVAEAAVRGSSEAGGGKPKGRSKYAAVKTEVSGIMFDSKREAERYRELVMLEAAKKISELRTKCPACVFDLTVNGIKVSRFTADFVYTQDGRRVVEDLKSGPTKTRAYVMRRKLMKAIHGIEILETK